MSNNEIKAIARMLECLQLAGTGLSVEIPPEDDRTCEVCGDFYCRSCDYEAERKEEEIDE